ncbi:hypothetical protein O181_118740 [Austropuccinia psidii MF-1]|uniref:Uncharacterized protein n=1 Tax=Austropuccinia psidii MF-1 TaxID=1389203 RepID=A0A9Q3KGZ3_9BASI|nr:hypothetical protein [Austropuccinia psidii MF-1]
MPTFPFSVAAFTASELQFCPNTLKLRLLRVLQLLRSSQLHQCIKDHLHTTHPSLSFSPAPLRSTSPMFVLLNKTPRIPPDKTLLFLVCLESKPHGNPLQAQVAPDGQRNYSANPPKPKSNLFLARVHPPNHLRTIQLMSQNLRWLLHNPRRNLLLVLPLPAP